MFNPKELNRVTVANTRGSSINYDIAYSYDTNKFRVSPEFYDQADLANHGLTLLEDKKNSRLILAAEPNNVAVMHRGKEGANKGREFTASRLRVKLDEYGFKKVEKFSLTEEAEVEGIKYYAINMLEGEQAPEVDDSQPETVPVDYVPAEGDDTPDFGDVGAAETEQEMPDQDSEQRSKKEDSDLPDHDDLDNLLG